MSGAIYPAVGQDEEGIEPGREVIRSNPDLPPSYSPLMFNYIAPNRLDHAKATYEKAHERKLKNAFFHLPLYQIAFLRNDLAGMAQRIALSMGELGMEDALLGLEAKTAAYSGQLSDARKFSRRAVDCAERAQEKEPAALYSVLSNLRETCSATQTKRGGLPRLH